MKKFSKTGGASPLSSQRAAGPDQQEVGKNLTGHEINKGFGGIDLVKILRYYGTKALRSNSRVIKSNLQYVILKCLSVSEQRLEGFAKAKTATPFIASEQEMQDNRLNIGVPCHVILNLFQDLVTVAKRMPPTLALPLKGGREKLVSEAHRKELNVLTSYRLNDFKKKAAFTLAEGATHVDMLDNIRRVAFTLAEVLITLAIIGVVAAMTIPTLITSYKEKQTVSQLTKVYSTLASAYQMMTVEYGPINTWGLNPTNTGIIDEETGKTIYDRSGNDVFTERLRKYLRVSKICESGKVCYPGASYNIAGDKLTEANSVFNEGNDTSPSSNFFLHDGTFVAPGWYEGGSANAFYWGTIYVVLPLGKDNILGKTKFYFRYNAKGLFPTGAKDDPAYRFEDSCDPSDHRTTSGQHCTAWVIYNKNMDYLHCRDKLSWEGAHSCKEAE